MKIFWPFNLFFVWTMTFPATGSMQPCGRTQGPCDAGCWNPTGTIESDDFRNCEPVGPGFFSPMTDDRRYPCQGGSFSDSDTAPLCSLCDAGSYSDDQATTCSLCPRGFYNNLMGSQLCMQCNPRYYDGEGSNFAMYLELPDEGQQQQVSRDLYCRDPTMESIAPMATMGPMIERDQPATPVPSPPTSAPTTSPMSSPSTPPTISPTAAPTAAPTMKTQAPTSGHNPTSMPMQRPSINNENENTAVPTISPSNRSFGDRGFDNVNGGDAGPAKTFFNKRYLLIAVILTGLILVFALFVLWTRLWRRQKAKRVLDQAREALKNRPVPPPPSPDKAGLGSNSDSIHSVEDADLFFDNDQLDEMERSTNVVFPTDQVESSLTAFDGMDQESVFTDIGASTWSVPVAVCQSDEESI